MRANSADVRNAVEDRLLSWRLLWIGAVGVFLALVTALGWTTTLKLAAGFYFIVGWYHHFQEYEFWVLGLNRSAETRPNQWAPRDLALLILPYAAFLGMAFSQIQFEFFLLAALYNGIVHDGIIPQYVLNEEAHEENRRRRTTLLLLHLPALILFGLGIAGGVLDYAYKGELHHAVTGFSRYAQLLGEPNPWFLAISSFIAYAHAVTWITTIAGRIQARAELARRYGSPIARAVRYAAGAFFVAVWSYGLWQAWPDNPEGFHIVTTVFLFSSLLHQWSELVFVFKYYGTAARRLEVAA
jgi:hypothetical protein